MKSLLKKWPNRNRSKKYKTKTISVADTQHLDVVSEKQSIMGFVLGSGIVSCDYKVTVVPSSPFNASSSSSATSMMTPDSPLSTPKRKFLRHSSSFLRVADLELQVPLSPSSSTAAVAVDDVSSICSDSASAANFSYAAVDPPPGVDHDPDERWVALDDGAGSHAPIAPMAIKALARIGMEAAVDRSMWTRQSAARHFKAAPWHTATWPSADGTTTTKLAAIPNDILPEPNSKLEEMVLLWMGKFQHGLYGHELPAVRAVGIIPAPAEILFELLIDSNRVKEYNKMSLGRDDLLVLQDNLHEHGPFGKGVTKLMRSRSRAVHYTMEFITMLHAQELEDGSGYLIVTRAVTHPDSSDSSSTHHEHSVLRSEILLGANLIRKIDGDENRCVMINVIHMRSPMVPMIIANRIGATAASNFIKDLRNAFVH